MKFSQKLGLILCTLFLPISVWAASNCTPPGGEVTENFISCCQPFNKVFVPVHGYCKEEPACTRAGVVREFHLQRTCCQGLIEDNDTHLCEDKSPVDSTLVSCAQSGANTCGAGLGCYPQRVDDLYSSLPGSQSALASQNTLQASLDNQLDSESLSNGNYCIKNTNCKSYNCFENKCTETFICRKPDEGENAGNLECEEGMVKDENNICKNPNSQVQSSTSALILSAQPQQVGTQCQVEFPDGLKEKAELAIRSVRAFEWLLSTSNSHPDCLNQQVYLKSVGDKFVARRKELLKMFNEGMAKVASYQTSLLAAADGKKNITLISADDVSMTSHDLASRRTSGYDMLRIMEKRNIVFKAYESEMNKLVNLTFDRVDKLINQINTGGGGWADHQLRSWSIPRETGVSAEMDNPVVEWGNPIGYVGSQNNCRNAIWIGWPLNQYIGRLKVYKRWHSNDVMNTSILANQEVNEDLVRITYNEDLRDPTLLAQRKTELNNKLRIPSGKIVYAMDPLNSYASYDSVRAKMKEFFAGLKANPNLSSFNYEPELLPLEAKDCIENPAGPQCDKFEKFLDRVSQTAFAQRYAYSIHNRYNYKFFFNSDPMRKKLFEHWKVQLGNLSQYYKDMAMYRDTQNACYRLLMGDIQTHFLDTAVGGITEGHNNSYVGEDFEGDNSIKSLASKTLNVGNKSSFEFEASLLKSLPWNKGFSTTPPKDGKYGAGTMVINSGALASRVKTGLGSAPNAIANIKKLSDQSNGLQAANTSGSQAAASGGPSSSASLTTPDASKASLGDDTKKEMASSSAPGASGSSRGSYQVPSSKFAESSGASLSDSPDKSKDPTGMSDDEKDMIMANYDRTRGRYKTKEEDTLFDIIGKTYVRNLDKILKRKSAASPE